MLRVSFPHPSSSPPPLDEEQRRKGAERLSMLHKRTAGLSATHIARPNHNAPPTTKRPLVSSRSVLERVLRRTNSWCLGDPISGLSQSEVDQLQRRFERNLSSLRQNRSIDDEELPTAEDEEDRKKKRRQLTSDSCLDQYSLSSSPSGLRKRTNSKRRRAKSSKHSDNHRKRGTELEALLTRNGGVKKQEHDKDILLPSFSAANSLETLKEAEVAAEPETEPEVGEPVLNFEDLLPDLRDGMKVLTKDSFTRCFTSHTPRPWNWNFYLYPLWLMGIFIRFCILFPIRLLVLCVGTCIFFSVFFTVSTLLAPFLPTENRKALQRRCISFYSFIFVLSWTGVVKYHGVRPRPNVPGRIVVANHTSLIDVVILQQDNMCYSIVGQKHTGLVGFIQNYLLGCLGCLWFERTQTKDRLAVAQKIKEHIHNPDNLPLLVFPEGTCVNNEYCVMFKKGAFELDATVHPVAIKYNKLFCDPFWNSRKQSFLQHLFVLMTSWALVCDVYYLEPTQIRKRRRPTPSIIKDINNKKKHKQTPQQENGKENGNETVEGEDEEDERSNNVNHHNYHNHHVEEEHNNVGSLTSDSEMSDTDTESEEEDRDETPLEFANRVKKKIAKKAGLVNVHWDGYLKYFRPSQRFTEERQHLFAKNLLKSSQSTLLASVPVKEERQVEEADKGKEEKTMKNGKNYKTPRSDKNDKDEKNDKESEEKNENGEENGIYKTKKRRRGGQRAKKTLAAKFVKQRRLQRTRSMPAGSISPEASTSGSSSPSSCSASPASSSDNESTELN